MLVPLSWLKDFVDIQLSPLELAHRLTLAGLEVAAVEQIGDWWDREKLIVGEVQAVRPHPNADRLEAARGWLDAGGERQEKVYDVVWAGDRKPDSI